MQNIIKVTDSEINVENIMKEIILEAKRLNMTQVNQDTSVLNDSIDYSSDSISPLIIPFLKKPTSRKSGNLAKASNKVLTKIFYIIWNTVGDIFTQQQEINKQIIKKEDDLEKKILNLQQQIDKSSNSVLNSNKIYDLFNYVEFENIMRGDTKFISDKQQEYLKLVAPKSRVLDIGCGRGEFLSLLKGKGINAEGIDLSEEMIKICHQQGLNVFREDALSLLNSTEHKYGTIIAAQVVEHMDYPTIIEMIKLAYDKLEEGGVLILETPNPTTVATHIGGFYSDPTHLHFIHPYTLKFICEQAGFHHEGINYSSLQDNRLDIPEEMDGVMKKNLTKLNDVMFGFQDYAVIERKVTVLS